MPIPKVIYQTFKSSDLPFLTKWQVKRFRKKNPEYVYEFYDDERIDNFIFEEFDKGIYDLYKRINIGAAKADFFRYAILLKKGGIYLDIDSTIKGKLNDFILPTDNAIISAEKNPNLFVQWGLIYEKEHPFLNKVMEMVIENLRLDKYPNDVHKMTGPTVYTEAINQCIKEGVSSYRILGTDYNGYLRFKYPLAKVSLYQKGEHWKQQQENIPVLKKEN